MTERPDVDEALRRLLGGDGPDLDCDVCFSLLDRYVDLELAGLDAGRAIPAMRVHLAGCPACREQYQALRAFVRGEPGTP